MIKISVMIPVYNAQDYLKRCLDSVCNQTLKDIEIICVNDCSTDNSLTILYDYKNKYSNLKIIDCKENAGESAARNIGLDLATGEYLAFVDNDDEIDLDFYEKLYNKAIETDADIVKGECHMIDYDSKEVYGNLNKKIKKNSSKFFFAYHWWTAIYKASMIKDNNICFPINMPLGGDVLFLNETILACNKLELIDDVFYHYYRREDSGDSKILSFEKVKSVLDIHEKIIDNVNQFNIYKVDKKGYDFIVVWCLRACLNYAFRNKTINTLKFCVNKAFDVYNKTKNNIKIEIILNQELPVILNYIKNDDKEGLFSFYLQNDTQQKMLMANLRFIHNKKKE